MWVLLKKPGQKIGNISLNIQIAAEWMVDPIDEWMVLTHVHVNPPGDSFPTVKPVDPVAHLAKLQGGELPARFVSGVPLLVMFQL